MLVRDVMTRRVFTLSTSDSFPKAVAFLLQKNISGAPVINKKGKVVGVISEKDLFHKLFPSQKKFYKDISYYMNFDNIEFEARKVRRLKMRKIMSKQVVTIAPDEHVLKAVSLFLTHDIRRVVVIEKGKMVGIVTTNDIYRNFLMHLVEKLQAV
jgi:CBS domain-containing protein